MEIHIHGSKISLLLRCQIAPNYRFSALPTKILVESFVSIDKVDVLYMEKEKN